MTRPLDELLALAGVERPAAPAEPDFSVIVRTEGARPRSLADSMESIANQTLEPRETLVMVHSAGVAHDDGRAERVSAALSQTGRPLPSSWRTIAVEGGSRSRPLNAGIEAAAGDYVTFLDDDDLARPEWIEAFARAATEHPGAAIRAVTLSQPWTTGGGSEPLEATGPIPVAQTIRAAKMA